MDLRDGLTSADDPAQRKALSLSPEEVWSRVEEAATRALALSPDYLTGHQWYGEHLAKTGRREEAVRHLLRAVELDPLRGDPRMDRLLREVGFSQD